VTRDKDEDPFVVVRDAFDAAKRRLDDEARVMRGDVKAKGERRRAPAHCVNAEGAKGRRGERLRAGRELLSPRTVERGSAPYRGKHRTNHAAASRATCSRVPGSSKRCVACGTTANSFSQASLAYAASLSSITP